MSLYTIAAQDDETYRILTDRTLNHQEAYEHLVFSHGLQTSRTSVRRARAKLGVLSPLSPEARLTFPGYDSTPEKASLFTKLKGLFRLGRS